jgi:hypothetical protein
MKRISLVLVLLLSAYLGYSQKGQDIVSLEEILETINTGLEDQAFEKLRQEAHSKEDNVIFNVKYLYPNVCYRQLITKATGQKLYIQVACDAIHAKNGLTFKEEEAYERYQFLIKNKRKFDRLDRRIERMHN